MNLSDIPTAKMVADCFTKPQQRPTFLKQGNEMGMIGIRLGNPLGIGICNGLRNGPGNGHGNGVKIGTGNGIVNSVGK